MNLAIDLDGVVYPFVDVFRAYVERAIRRPLPEPVEWDFWKEWEITLQDFQLFMREGVLSRYLWWQGEPIDGARETLKRLSRDHSITIVTNRSIPGAEQEARWATEFWLSSHQIPHDGLIIASDKTNLGFDLILDDGPPNIKAARDAGERCLIYHQTWNAREDGERVTGWDHFEAVVGC